MDEKEKLRLLEEAIAKAKGILDGYNPAIPYFSIEECMKIYSCVYDLCAKFDHGYLNKLRDRYQKALEESIFSKVLPSLMDKNGVPLLIELLHLWANYKVMVKFLTRFFRYMDNHVIQRKNAPPLLFDTAVRSFDEQVCKVLHERLTSAALFLITEDRNGVPIDRSLLQGLSTFYLEVDAQGRTTYYDMYEGAILADAAIYCSRLAPKWYLCHSSTTYVLKVEQFLIEEKGRTSQFMNQSSVEKLLQVVRRKMIEEYADKLAKRQKTENMNSIVDQDLATKCWSSLNIE